MNIAHILTPKISVAFVYDDCSVRQGLEKLRHYGYTSIPVLARDGSYVGAISEGDLLWYLLDMNAAAALEDRKDVEELALGEVPRRDRNQPVQITASMEELLEQSINQNFIPVIDDRNVFIGIVTRKQILQYYADGLEAKPQA